MQNKLIALFHTTKKGMRIVREGTNTVGLQFKAYRARYLARGWIRSIAMVDGGPKQLKMYFGKTLAATTEDGTFTRANFSDEALALMDSYPTLVPSDTGLFNLCAIQDIFLDAPEPTQRQNYYAVQTWVQVFDQKPGTSGTQDLDFTPVPCIRAFNLISGDPTATVLVTTPLRENTQ